MRIVAALALALSLAGCSVNFDESTLVTVASRRKVAVGVQTPRGGQWLSPADSDDTSPKEVPDSNPPLTEGDKFAQVQRSGGGAVHLNCPSCKYAQDADVVSYSTPITLHGPLGRNIRWNGDYLGMRYSHIAYFPCYKHPSHDCPREALALWLQTEKSNVVEIRHTKRVITENGERNGAYIGLGVGGVGVAAGLAIESVFAFDSDARSGITFAVGATFLAVGTAFLVTSVMQLLAKDSDTVTYRRPRE